MHLKFGLYVDYVNRPSSSHMPRELSCEDQPSNTYKLPLVKISQPH
jgi:hypothetical protein